MVIYLPEWVWRACNLLNWNVPTKDSIQLMTFLQMQTGETQKPQQTEPLPFHLLHLPVFMLELEQFIIACTFCKILMKPKSLLITTSMIYSFPFQLLSRISFWFSKLLQRFSCIEKETYKWTLHEKVGKRSTNGMFIARLVKRNQFRGEAK